MYTWVHFTTLWENVWIISPQKEEDGTSLQEQTKSDAQTFGPDPKAPVENLLKKGTWGQPDPTQTAWGTTTPDLKSYGPEQIQTKRKHPKQLTWLDKYTLDLTQLESQVGKQLPESQCSSVWRLQNGAKAPKDHGESRWLKVWKSDGKITLNMTN